MEQFEKDNPYTASGSSGEALNPSSWEEWPKYTLFTPTSVAIASFLGGCLGGGVVMAINYTRVGKAANAVAMIIASLVLLAALVVAVVFVPQLEGVPGVILNVAQATVMCLIAQLLQGHMLADHMRRGGDTASGWLGAGIGCLTSVVLAVVLVGLLFMVGELAGLGELVGIGWEP